MTGGALVLGVASGLLLSACGATALPTTEAMPTPGSSVSATLAPPTARTSPLANTPDIEQGRLDVIQAVNTDPVRFGGVLQTPGGGLVIFYVGPNAGRGAVERMIPPGLRVQWRHVARSNSDLMRMLREIVHRNLDGVQAVSIDVVKNQVHVHVTPPDLVLSVSIALAPDYGDAIFVTGGPPAVVH
ncbi:MAG: hypothetical protein ABI744_03380 [Chloroflexota bacterium]